MEDQHYGPGWIMLYFLHFEQLPKLYFYIIIGMCLGYKTKKSSESVFSNVLYNWKSYGLSHVPDSITFRKIFHLKPT